MVFLFDPSECLLPLKLIYFTNQKKTGSQGQYNVVREKMLLIILTTISFIVTGISVDFKKMHVEKQCFLN